MFGKKEKKKVKIEGMHCSHCVKRVEEALSSLDTVKKVKVNLSKGEADIISEKEISNDLIKNKIEELDFKVTDIS
ncbi:MAG: heavy-metal-associated domain-containing protein [Bacilli bacterium]|jgi:copper chaperone CopZ|nr:heavy-metal-associated domain-containing protein [Bacilli bacterium]